MKTVLTLLAVAAWAACMAAGCSTGTPPPVAPETAEPSTWGEYKARVQQAQQEAAGAAQGAAGAGKASTDCTLAAILAGTCGDTADPTLDEVPEGYETPADEEPADADTVATSLPDTLRYMRMVFMDGVAAHEQALFTEAALLLDRLVLQGHPDGLEVVLVTNDRSNFEFMLPIADSNGFNTHCRVQLNSLAHDRYHLDPCAESNFKRVARHEMLHCLGWGVGPGWRSLLVIDGANTRFMGAKASQSIGRASVPVRPPGQRGALHHWAHEVAGWQTNTYALTAAMLDDIGYEVNYDAVLPWPPKICGIDY